MILGDPNKGFFDVTVIFKCLSIPHQDSHLKLEKHALLRLIPSSLLSAAILNRTVTCSHRLSLEEILFLQG